MCLLQRRYCTTSHNSPARVTGVYRALADRPLHLASMPSGFPLSGDSYPVFSTIELQLQRSQAQDGCPRACPPHPSDVFWRAWTGKAFREPPPPPSGRRSSWSWRLIKMFLPVPFSTIRSPAISERPITSSSSLTASKPAGRYLRSPELEPRTAVETQPDTPIFRCTH